MYITPPQKPRARRRRLIVAALLVATVVIAALATYVFISYANKQSEMETLRSSQPSQSAKQDMLDKNNDSDSTNSGLPQQSTTITNQDVPIDTSLSISIDSITQADGRVRSNASTSGDGTCVFLFEPADGGRPISRQTSTSSKSCSVDIPENEFAYLGQWKLTVTFYSNGQKMDTSRNVTVN